MKPHPLKVAREERGWSQSKVAKAVGVNVRTVSRWESWLAMPHPYYREQLSLLFGKTISELGLLDDSDKNDSMLEVVPASEESPTPNVAAQGQDSSLGDDVQLDEWETQEVVPAIEESPAPNVAYGRLQQSGITNQPAVEESPAPNVAAQGQDSSLGDDVQLDTYPVHPAGRRRFSFQSLWDVGIGHMRRISIFRAFDRSSRHAMLMVAMILLAGLVIIAVLLISR